MSRRNKSLLYGALAIVGIAFVATRANAAEAKDHDDDVEPDPEPTEPVTEPTEPTKPVVEPTEPTEPTEPFVVPAEVVEPVDLPSIMDDPFGDFPPPKAKPKRIGGRKPKPTEPFVLPAEVVPEEPEDVGPTFEELLTEYPRGERFYQVVSGDRFGGTNSSRSIAYRYLLSEAYLAAIEYGQLSPEEAQVWASTVAKNDKVRAKVIDLIQCSGWNDACYGAAPKSNTRESKNGRSILLLELHAPIAELLGAGQQPVRNATMGGGLVDKSWRNHELLWLPAIDREALWDSGGTEISTATGNTVWSDGTSKDNPPPWVMALGLDDNSGEIVDGRSFGCPGSEGELEV